VHDVLQVLERAREPVDAGDHERVAAAQEVEEKAELGPPLAVRPAPLLGPDQG
jgi:hypothetical protein